MSAKPLEERAPMGLLRPRWSKKIKPEVGVVPPKIEAEADDADGAIRRPTPRRAATFWETNVFLPFCAPILLRLRAVELFKRYCVEPAPDQPPTFWDACVIMFFCEPMLLCLRAVGLVRRYCVDPAPEQAPTFWEKCFIRTFDPPILSGLRVAEQVKQFLYSGWALDSVLLGFQR